MGLFKENWGKILLILFPAVGIAVLIALGVGAKLLFPFVWARYLSLALVFVGLTWASLALFTAIEGDDKPSDPLTLRLFRVVAFIIVFFLIAAVWSVFKLLI